MRIDLITLFPEMISAVADYGVTGRAVRNGLLVLRSWDLREFAVDQHRSVDSRPYGGGPGMVLSAPPLRRALQRVQGDDESPGMVVALSASGTPLNSSLARELAQRPRLVLIAGRYAGIDQRVLNRDVDMEVSVGDVILSGGELPALMLIDAVGRLLPGVLGNRASAQDDAFGGESSDDGALGEEQELLDHPRYARPVDLDGDRVPEVLLSGDHRAIAQWREQQARQRTRQLRPDLLHRDDAALVDEGGLELEADGGENDGQSGRSDAGVAEGKD